MAKYAVFTVFMILRVSQHACEDVSAISSTNATRSLRGAPCESARTPESSKCTGCPPMYNGKLCSSTTRYNNQNLGACGCGMKYRSDYATGVHRSLPKDYWTLTSYTAAMSCVNLNPAGGALAWCPQECGSCYKLCSTGGLVQSGHHAGDKDNHPPDAGVCKTFKVVDRCGDGFDQGGKPNWCSQRKSATDCKSDPRSCASSGNTNWFGYPAHFDLQDFHGQILDGLGWDNVEVTFEKVSCDSWNAPANVETCSGCTA